MRNKIKKAFTLVELVVVIAIIAVLSAISVGGYFVYISQAQKTEINVMQETIYKTYNSLVTKTSVEVEGKTYYLLRNQDGTIDVEESTGATINKLLGSKILITYMNNNYTAKEKIYSFDGAKVSEGTGYFTTSYAGYTYTVVNGVYKVRDTQYHYAGIDCEVIDGKIFFYNYITSYNNVIISLIVSKVATV